MNKVCYIANCVPTSDHVLLQCIPTSIASHPDALGVGSHRGGRYNVSHVLSDNPLFINSHSLFLRLSTLCCPHKLRIVLSMSGHPTIIQSGRFCTVFVRMIQPSFGYTCHLYLDHIDDLGLTLIT